MSQTLRTGCCILFCLITACSLSAQPRKIAEWAFNHPSFTPQQAVVGNTLFFTRSQVVTDQGREELVSVDIAGNVRVVSSAGQRPVQIWVQNGMLLYISHEFSPDDDFLSVLCSVNPSDGRVTVLQTLNGRSQVKAFAPGYALLDGATGLTSNKALWRTDGTPAGTFKLLDDGTFIQKFVVLDNGTLLFWEAKFDSNNVIWSTDGTAAGTTLLHEHNSFSSYPNLTNMGSYALFTTNNELWRTDGTPNGTALVAQAADMDITEWYAFDPYSLRVNNNMLFMARHNTRGIEIWQTNGTTLGTTPFFSNGQTKLALDRFFSVNNKHYIVGEGHLWETDGTEAGTRIAVRLREDWGVRQIGSVIPFADKAILMAITEGYGNEPLLFQGSDITPIDLWPGNGDSYINNYIRHIKIVDNAAFLPALSPGTGTELWRISTDGQKTLAADIAPGAAWSSPEILDTLRGELYFLARGTVGKQQLYKMPLATQAAAVPTARPYQWVQGIQPFDVPDGNGESVFNDDFAVTPTGKVYLSGQYLGYTGIGFSNSPVFIERTFQTAKGLFPRYIAQLSASGEPKWIQWIGGGSYYETLPLAPAPEEGVFTAGTYNDEAIFGNITRTTSSRRMYLTRFDSSGKLLWLKEAAIGSKGKVLKMASDKEGNVWLAGFYGDFLANFEGTILQSPVDPSWFIARYDANGKLLTAISIPSPAEWEYYGDGMDMSIGPDGRLYIVLGNAWYNVFQSCAFTNRYFKVLCMENDGNIAWERTFSSDDLTFPAGLMVNSAGLIHIVGLFRGNLDIGGNILSTFSCERSGGFWLTMTSEGKVFNAAAEIDAVVGYYDVATDTEGNTYLAGIESRERGKRYDNFEWPFPGNTSTVFVRKYNAARALVSERSLNKLSEGWDSQKPLIAVQSNGDVLLHDRYVILVDTITDLPMIGSTSAYVMRFRMTGDPALPAPDSQLASDDVQIFPNPASDFVLLSARDADFLPDKITVWDVVGRSYQIARTRLQETVAYWDVRHLPAGMYIFNIETGEKQVSKKLIVQR
jgi:hypothetical protein